jgi:hypothetical protein
LGAKLHQISKWDLKWKLVILFLSGLLVSGILLKLPIILLDAQGKKVGIDIAIYTYWANIFLQVKHVPEWSLYLKYEPPWDYAPGFPILIASISQATGIEPIRLTMPFYVLTFAAIHLSLYVMLVSYVNKRWLGLLGLFFWIFASGYSSEPALILAAPDSNWTLGMSPTNVIGFLLLIIFLSSALKIIEKRDLSHFSIMLFVIVGTMIFHQLTFMLIILFLLFFLAFYHKQIDRKFLLMMLTMVILATVTHPDYIHYVSPKSLGPPDPESLGWVNLTSVKLIDIPRFSGLSAVFLAIFGIFFSILRSETSSVKAGALGLLANVKTLYLVVCFLSLTILMHYGPYWLGINGRRFLYYSAIFLLPLMINGISKLFGLAQKNRVTRVLTLFAVALIMVLSLIQGVTTTTRTFALQPNRIFDDVEQEAARYLKETVSDNEIIIADLQATRDTAWLLPFSMRYVLIRSSDYIIHTTSHPFDIPLKLADRILKDPNPNSVKDGYTLYNFTFYFFEKTDNWKEVQTFDVLPYFTKVFENAETVIYKVNPLRFEDALLVQAEDFKTASEGLSSTRFSGAIGPDPYRTAVSSNKPDNKPAQAAYEVNVPTEGTYTFVFRRYVYQPQEYIVVVIDGTPTGVVTFSQKGWQFGKLTNVIMSRGHHSITLIFQATVGYIDPLDYFVLVREVEQIRPR